MCIFIKRKKYKTILKEWLSKKRINIKEQSYIKYQHLINNYINPILGDVKEKRLMEGDIINFFNDEKITTLSQSSRQTIIYIINNSTNNKFKICIEDLFKGKNKYKHNNLKYFTKKEQKVLEEYIYNHLNIKTISILLCLYTGLRIGEVCGLKWEDIDFKNKLLTVKRTIQRIPELNRTNFKTKVIESIPKTDNSYRKIPIPTFLLSMLEEFKDIPTNYIVSNRNKPKEPRVLSRYFSHILKEIKVTPLSFHSLRHTFATRSLEAKMDIKTLSEILGHSSYKTTLEIYAHSSIELKRESMNNMVTYINSKKKK